MKFFKTTLLPLLLLGHQSAYSYSISTHEFITKKVVEEFNFCASHLGLKKLPVSAEKTLVDSNLNEDKNFILKIFNWHFYNPSKNLEPATNGIGHGSLKWRFFDLQNQIEKRPSLELLGGLMHYVQDMTNPAHVAPVFHIFSDSFDNYDFVHNFPAPITEQECRTLMTSKELDLSYFDVLDRLAYETLERIEESFPVTLSGITSTMTWRQAFWNPEVGPKSEKKGFGQYGELGNEFGSTVINKAKVNPEVYSEFAKQQVRYSLNASLIYLMIYSKHHR